MENQAVTEDQAVMENQAVTEDQADGSFQHLEVKLITPLQQAREKKESGFIWSRERGVRCGRVWFGHSKSLAER